MVCPTQVICPRLIKYIAAFCMLDCVWAATLPSADEIPILSGYASTTCYSGGAITNFCSRNGAPTRSTWNTLLYSPAPSGSGFLLNLMQPNNVGATVPLRASSCVGEDDMAGSVDINLGEDCTLAAGNGFGCKVGLCYKSKSSVACSGGSLASPVNVASFNSNSEYRSLDMCEGARYVKLRGGGSCGSNSFLDDVNTTSDNLRISCTPPSPPPAPSAPPCTLCTGNRKRDYTDENGNPRTSYFNPRGYYEYPPLMPSIFAGLDRNGQPAYVSEVYVYFDPYAFENRTNPPGDPTGTNNVTYFFDTVGCLYPPNPINPEPFKPRPVLYDPDGKPVNERSVPCDKKGAQELFRSVEKGSSVLGPSGRPVKGMAVFGKFDDDSYGPDQGSEFVPVQEVNVSNIFSFRWCPDQDQFQVTVWGGKGPNGCAYPLLPPDYNTMKADNAVIQAEMTSLYAEKTSLHAEKTSLAFLFGKTSLEKTSLQTDLEKCNVDKALNAVDVLSRLENGTIKLVFV